jgi:hypothetical protein
MTMSNECLIQCGIGDGRGKHASQSANAKNSHSMRRSIKAAAAIGFCCVTLLQVYDNAISAQEAPPSRPTVPSLTVLADLATEALSDTNFLAKPRFSIDPANHIFYYDSDPKALSLVVAAGDPYAVPLDASRDSGQPWPIR